MIDGATLVIRIIIRIIVIARIFKHKLRKSNQLFSTVTGELERIDRIIGPCTAIHLYELFDQAVQLFPMFSLFILHMLGTGDLFYNFVILIDLKCQ